MFQGTSENGHKLELLLSRDFHQQGIPLLISPLWLRSQGAGQVDMARIFKNEIQMLEVKAQGFLSKRQESRLLLARKLIALVLKKPVNFKCYRVVSAQTTFFDVTPTL